MASRIEDYALIGDCQSAALVGRDGSIDWLCLPRFDSDACFASLLGTLDNGFWKIAPKTPVRKVRRAYRPDTLTLETEMETDEGIIVLVDFMAVNAPSPSVVRIVCGKEGAVNVRMDLAIRCGYGKTVPWVRAANGGIVAVAGPDLLRLSTPTKTHGENLSTVSEVLVKPKERIPFVLDWTASHLTPPKAVNAEDALMECEAFWKKWAAQCTLEGPFTDIAKRSLLTLKALTYAPTGGIVAAPTTSLPERIGSVRNWDYRFCWVRDATFSLYSLLHAGYTDEARAWRDWLLRACAGAPSQLQILYGLAGERRLVEVSLEWLEGYEQSRPVRIGNAAAEQLQLDVYGELLDTMHLGRKSGLPANATSWALERALVNHVVKAWQTPDHGIWEVRGPARHFTHSKVMCWVAVDRAIKSVEQWNVEGPLDRWRAVRDAIHQDVCANAFDPSVGAFVQHYGSTALDASLLLLPIVGFLPPSDPRVIGTVDAIQRGLVRDGLVLRYVPEPAVEGLTRHEGTFLACSFWLVDALVRLGRDREARDLFERLVALRNDVGLLSEEYDPIERRFLGNFPQALSHVALVNSALNVSRQSGPARARSTL